MPTERFLRLPERKQQAIYDAAIEEFSRVPFDKASINRIIQRAKISRGSFYTYFPDKMDLLRYVTESKFNGIEGVLNSAVEETGGDYFSILERLFEYFVTESQRTAQMLDFLKNAMNNRDILQALGFSAEPPSPKRAGLAGSPLGRLYARVDHTRFSFKDPQDHVAMMTLGATTLLISILGFYNYPDQLELIRKNFHTSLEILKNGCYKSEEEAGGVKV